MTSLEQQLRDLWRAIDELRQRNRTTDGRVDTLTREVDEIDRRARPYGDGTRDDRRRRRR